MKNKQSISPREFGNLRNRALWSYKDLLKYLAYTDFDDVFDIWMMFEYEDKNRRRKTLMIRLLERARGLDTWRWVAEIQRQVSPKKPGLQKGLKRTKIYSSKHTRSKLILKQKKVPYADLS
jgi:hypothetical protein